MMTDPYKLFNCVLFPAGKSNNAEFRMVYTLTRSLLKSVFLISKMLQKKAEFSQLKMWVHKNTEILRRFLQEM